MSFGKHQSQRRNAPNILCFRRVRTIPLTVINLVVYYPYHTYLYYVDRRLYLCNIFAAMSVDIM